VQYYSECEDKSDDVKDSIYEELEPLFDVQNCLLGCTAVG
jgi:hypothetical protein